eukprot:TRINITY_DN9379_c0_g3_i1.p1 TRINITY_DN9379_c0_g3~~TRINITY_DN9379_c0_g3_i1.p1  ORF type:complete len:150 (+),score=9.12 TRINITY_DN9379_c0_g3_i1:78-527(+)
MRHKAYARVTAPSPTSFAGPLSSCARSSCHRIISGVTRVGTASSVGRAASVAPAWVRARVATPFSPQQAPFCTTPGRGRNSHVPSNHPIDRGSRDRNREPQLQLQLQLHHAQKPETCPSIQQGEIQRSALASPFSQPPMHDIQQSERTG